MPRRTAHHPPRPSLPRALRRLLAALVLVLAPLAPAAAASLQVSPILLEFGPQEPSQALWLSNSGSAPLRAQVRVLRWTQADGSETLSPTRDLTASPAVLEVPPGERQLVRIVLLQPAQEPGERAYRVIIDELPDATAQEAGGLQFLLRYSIPVFADTPTQPNPAAAPLSASWRDGQLAVTNAGDRRVRLSRLTWVNVDGSRVPLVPGLVGYVLAGQRMQWPLDLPEAARAGGTLLARFDDAHEDQALPLLAPVR